MKVILRLFVVEFLFGVSFITRALSLEMQDGVPTLVGGQEAQAITRIYKHNDTLIITYTDDHGATGMYERKMSIFHTAPQRSHEGSPVPVLLWAPYDVAIRHDVPQEKRIKGAYILGGLLSKEDMASELLQANYLDLSSFNLLASQLCEFLVQADLSTIRTIDVSCASDQGTLFQANSFLESLFTNNRTLRSLMYVNADGSNIDKTTLETLRDQIAFQGSLIRDSWIMDEAVGMKVAKIHIKIQNTPIAQLAPCEKERFQRPNDRRFDILYRYNNYMPGSGAHLQLVFSADHKTHI